MSKRIGREISHCELSRRHHASEADGNGRSSARKIALSLGVTAGIMLVEAVGGWWSGSLALLADAGHMLTDAAALGLALLAIVFGSRPADHRRTFGFRRLEVLAAQINVATLLGLIVWIVYEAVDRLRSPPSHIDLPTMAGVAAIGLVGNGVIMFWLKGEHSLNVRSAFLHVLGDTVASVAVLAGAFAMWLRSDLWWIDPVLSITITLLILLSAVRLILEITDILMEAVPGHLELGEVCKLMEEADGVAVVHDLHIWTISSGLCALSAHLVVHPEAMGKNDEILTEVKSRLEKSFGIEHTTLQIESADYAHANDPHEH